TPARRPNLKKNLSSLGRNYSIHRYYLFDIPMWMSYKSANPWRCPVSRSHSSVAVVRAPAPPSTGKTPVRPAHSVSDSHRHTPFAERLTHRRLTRGRNPSPSAPVWSLDRAHP